MSFEKIVKLACKPKAAPPKAKYLDPIIAATYSEDGAVTDVLRALAPRLREPNATIVFKGLIVLHTMIRTGNTENVLSYLSQSDPLRLQNVASGHWEGYSAPENLGAYANYLQTRIKAYRDLKHDAVRVQSESNRDHRMSLEGDRDFGGSSGGGVSRSKTVVGRKLRVMSVEKGLLRETKIVQGVVDALVDTKFYMDNLEEELNVMALRMLVKDLLVLFQAVNEGVINILEHYFEMSHVDAESALGLYRRFCRQTEKVVEYLSVAKKLQNLLNVSVPNLKHAPVSLVNSLEEYLRDPNFEENRIEYKANKAAADGKPAPRHKTPAAPPPSSPPPASGSSSQPVSTPKKQPQSVADFFSSIEQEQATMFNPATGSPTANYFQQQATVNPFTQRQSTLAPQSTGAALFAQPTGNNAFFNAQQPFQQGQNAFLQPQATGFPQPQSGPFLSPQPQQQQGLAPQATGFPGQSNAFLSPQPQQPGGFLQPQPTGSNPFRQSMLFPQSTGFPVAPQATGLPAFGGGSSSPFGAPVNNHNPFPRPGSAGAFGSGPNRSNTLPPLQEMPTGAPQQGNNNAFSAFGNTNGNDLFGPLQPPNTSAFGNSIQRPASTPIKSNTNNNNGFPAGGVVSHQTGSGPGSNSRNPFGQPAPPPVPPLPKAPTLQQLATGAAWGGTTSSGPSTGPSTPLQAQPTGNGLIGSIASSFANGGPGPSSSPPPLPNNNSPFASFSQQNNTGTNGSSALSSQPTSSSTWSSAFGGSSAFSSATSTAPSTAASPQPLTAQPTGFGGSSVRPFKPSSSFGASIVDKLPTIPSEPATPAITGGPTGPLLGGFSGLNLGGNNSSAGAGAGSGGSGIPSFSLQSSGGALNSTSGSPAPGAGAGNPPSLFGASTGSNGGLGSGLGSGLGGGLGSGLRPQATGAAGAANPFRASMALGGGAGPGQSSGLGSSAFGNSGSPAPAFSSTFSSGPSSFGNGGGFGGAFGSGGAGAGGAPTLQPSFTGFGDFSSQFSGSAFGGSPQPGNNNQQQQQQSLI